MSFFELHLLKHYHSDSDDILKEFYRPILSKSIHYDRAVGFFSSGTFRSCAIELRDFVARSGRVRLIVGCITNKADIDAISKSEITTNNIEREALRSQILQYLHQLEGDDPNCARTFASLIAAGIVQIRFAIRDRGIYHEKFGIFEDDEGNRIAFIGSLNETSAAMDPLVNHESISVYDSRDTYVFQEYGQPLQYRFEQLWRGETKNTRIYDLDSETLIFIRNIAKRFDNEAGQPIRPTEGGDLRPYQREALVAWQNNSYKGILSMATGTGKTRTAIAAIERFRMSPIAGLVVITVPYQNLATQWRTELDKHLIPSFPVFQSYDLWFEAVKSFVLTAKYLGEERPPCLVCVNRTFNDARFRELLNLLSSTDPASHFLIVDEAHHFNSEMLCKELPAAFNLRMALSATPYDQFEGHAESRFLASYFGDIVFTFPLEKAIDDGYLCPYFFQYFVCALNPNESSEYEDLTRKLVRIVGDRDVRHPEVLSKIQPILLARSRIVAGAKDKLRILETHLRKTGKQSLSLFYCGDSSIDSDEGARRHVEVVTQLLDGLGWRTSRVTADESLPQREAILDSFARREIDALVSIKVLDEGIDIPATETAYLLASQSSDRQGIQRRGRVLRKHSSKTHATIYDFLVLGADSSSGWVKSLAAKELRRALQFAEAARNRDEQVASLKQQCNELGIKFEDVSNAPLLN